MNVRLDQLPSAESVPVKPIADAIASYLEAKAASNEAHQDLTTLEQTRAMAEETDRQRYADALDARKKPPAARPATEEHDQRIAKAKFHLEGVNALLERRGLALQSVCEEQSDALLEAALEAHDEASAGYSNAIEALAQAHAELQQRLQLLHFARTGQWRGGFASQVPLRHEAVAFDELTAALATLAAKPSEEGAQALVEFSRGGVVPPAFVSGA
jgi:hypothetical protein